jgi:hypothetical protein
MGVHESCGSPPAHRNRNKDARLSSARQSSELGMGLPLRSFGWLPVLSLVVSHFVDGAGVVTAIGAPAFAVEAWISTGRLTSAGEGAALAAVVGIEGGAMGDMR